MLFRILQPQERRIYNFPKKTVPVIGKKNWYQCFGQVRLLKSWIGSLKIRHVAPRTTIPINLSGASAWELSGMVAIEVVIGNKETAFLKTLYNFIEGKPTHNANGLFRLYLA